LTGDGELNEGVVWEAAMFAAHHCLDNLTLIIDRNRLQIAGQTEDVMRIEPLRDKWSAFGWDVFNVDGHDPGSIVAALNAAREIRGRPTVVIAQTKKGAGVSFMEHSTAWHYRAIDRSDARGLICEIIRSLGA
jgi:transketolase